MANPTPKALQGAAATLRSQATAARQAVEEQSRRRDGENQTALSKAGERQEAAQVSLKAAQSRADDAFKAQNEYRTQAHQLQQDARTAAQQGDAAKANDLNRQAANAAARSDEAAARSAQAQREVSDATVEAAESQKALSEAAGELRSRVIDPMEAETQITL